MRGQTVTLYEEIQVGVDRLNCPIYEEKPVTVEDVLIGEPATDEITSSVALYGKQITFMLGIPKGDTHDWENKKVSWTDAQGRTRVFQTFGFPIMGVEANIPGRWHMKVRCAAYG